MSKRRIRLLCFILVGVGASVCLVYNKNKLSSDAVLGVSTMAVEVEASLQNTEPTDRSPELYQGSFFYKTSREMLNALKVDVYPEDKIFAFPDPSLGLGSQIKIYRAQNILIKDSGHDTLVRSWAPNIQYLAQEQRLNLAEKDLVLPKLDQIITYSVKVLTVEITRVQESELIEHESVDYSTKYIDDPTLERGVKHTDQYGKMGKLEFRYLVRREDGVEVSRKLLEKKLALEPVVEVIRRGTKIIEYGTGKASWYAGVAPMTAAHLTLPFGDIVRVVNVNNGKSVDVRIADRGPFVPGRIIDLSDDAFSQISSTGTGVISVRLEK